MAKISFNNKGQVFYSSLKQSVDQYFQSQGLKKTGNWKLYAKAAVLFPLSISLYIFLLTASYSPFIGLVLSLVLGLALVSIAFNIMHDACHGSYSSKKWVNELLGLTMNALGSNAHIWKIKHNIVHHTYTNIDGIDDDISNGPLLRQCVTQKWMPLHRFQFLYMFVLYSVSTLSWMFVTDFYKYFSKKIHTTVIKKIDLKEHIIFWFSKLLYVTFYVAIPIYYLGWQPWLIGFLIIHATMGLSLSIVFQLAHTVEKTNFDSVGEDQKVIDSEWAIHEIRSTADFAAQNKVISWLIGGLNFQIEHHLFPKISHIHYPAISKIIKQACKDHGIQYNEFRKMRDAIVSHYYYMRRLGQA